MDKRQLQAYAVWAKENLETQIEVSLKTLGIFSDTDIKNAKIIGDVVVIEGDDHSYPRDLYSKRNSIVNLVKSEGYKQVIEEFAYTWFNRFVALRFMEVHDFIPHGFRVLSSRDGSVEPEVLKNLPLIKDGLGIDLLQCEKLKSVGVEELYRYVLFRQCKALSGILPMLFEADYDYLELLLPKTLLLGDTILTKLIALGDEPFLDDVEILGWMYQFYISAKKDEVNKTKQTITKDTLPAVTQLFTPDWIVRYMAENSVGRLWMESYPDSSLRGEMRYYVESPEQPEEVQRKIASIKYRDVNPENIKIIEPCCGSGHILVYVFNLLYKMYEEKGYQKREIPSLILSKNLFGLDVDKRASQLAAFSLVMKARSVNPRFFSATYYVKPNVYEIWDSRGLFNIGYKQLLAETNALSHDAIEDIEKLADSFRNAKTIGSLLKIKHINWERIAETLDLLENKVVYNIFNERLNSVGIRLIKKLVKQAQILSDKYDVMITNPPYIGISSMEEPVREYANTFYPNSKSDMFAMFMETEFVKTNGFLAMINMHSWMFLSSFEKLRRHLIDTQEIVTMAHLGAHAFETIGGEVVQTTAFVIRNVHLGGNGVYFRLVDSKDKENDFVNNLSNGGGVLFIANAIKFTKIPGYPIAYWISDKLVEAFSGAKLGEIAAPRQGLATGDNNKFLRLWFEIDIENAYFNATDGINAFASGKKWFPCNKGGAFRKWYGNNAYLIDWLGDGCAIKNFAGAVIRNSSYYFRQAGTWSTIASANFSMRYSPKGFLFESKGSGCFANDDRNLFYIIGFLNSKPVKSILLVLSPTLDYHEGPLGRVPIIFDHKVQCQVDELVSNNIAASKVDWDSFETSWDFKKHPLI